VGDPHEDDPDPRFTALYEGVVIDNRDPEKLGRVKLMVPGLIEPASGWALPLACAGGGSDANGFYFVPKLGAEVAVFFVQGDTDHPRYLIGAWGKPAAEAETPTFARALSPEEAVLVRGIQTDRWEIVFDDRPGHESMRIKDLQFDDILEIDGVGHGVTIAGSAAVVIRSTGVVSVEALQILLNGRIVRDTSEPI
jgi:uncharacterized protein involved in type VI secretion and phage assembly